jgi:hypothetical protein
MEPNELRFILTWSRPDIALQSFLSVPGAPQTNKPVCNRRPARQRAAGHA